MSSRALWLAGLVAALGTMGTAHADPLEAVIRARVAPAMPAGLDVAKVHLSPTLAKLEVDPAHVAVEVSRELRAGRPSVKVIVRGRPAQFVPLSISAVAEVAVAQHRLEPGAVIGLADVIIEQRAVDGAAPASVNSVVGATVSRVVVAGAAVGKADVTLPPPLARGTQVAVEIRRGSVRVRGQATLELSARPGEQAAARLAQTKQVVRGTLVAPATLVVEAGD